MFTCALPWLRVHGIWRPKLRSGTVPPIPTESFADYSVCPLTGNQIQSVSGASQMHVTNVAFEGHVFLPQLPTLKPRSSSLVKQAFAASSPQEKQICGFWEETATCLIQKQRTIVFPSCLFAVSRRFCVGSASVGRVVLQRTSRNCKSRQTSSVFGAN